MFWLTYGPMVPMHVHQNLIKTTVLTMILSPSIFKICCTYRQGWQAHTQVEMTLDTLRTLSRLTHTRDCHRRRLSVTLRPARLLRSDWRQPRSPHGRKLRAHPLYAHYTDTNEFISKYLPGCPRLSLRASCLRRSPWVLWLMDSGPCGSRFVYITSYRNWFVFKIRHVFH